MKYFAYGSNLCETRLKHRGMNPPEPSLARLTGYELRFNKKSDDGSSKANIMKGEQNSEVWGVVFEISVNELEELRKAEKGYDEKSVEVFIAGADTKTEVTAYIAQEDKLAENLQPFSWYLAHIVLGAEKFKFPDEYVAHLKATPSTTDPCKKRERKERGYWD